MPSMSNERTARGNHFTFVLFGKIRCSVSRDGRMRTRIRYITYTDWRSPCIWHAGLLQMRAAQLAHRQLRAPIAASEQASAHDSEGRLSLRYVGTCVSTRRRLPMTRIRRIGESCVAIMFSRCRRRRVSRDEAAEKEQRSLAVVTRESTHRKKVYSRLQLPKDTA
jgi:hypothetical protein